LHSPERLAQVLKTASLTSFSGFVYRIVPDRWRTSPLSAIGAVTRGGRFNSPSNFPILYTADSQFTALREVEALFVDAEGRLRGAPRDPDLILTLECTLLRVLDLTSTDKHLELGTSREELTALSPSRFLLNARGLHTAAQELGLACFESGRISAIKAPSAVHDGGYCIDILTDSLVDGERVTIRDEAGSLRAELAGQKPRDS